MKPQDRKLTMPKQVFNGSNGKFANKKDDILINLDIIEALGYQKCLGLSMKVGVRR